MGATLILTLTACLVAGCASTLPSNAERPRLPKVSARGLVPDGRINTPQLDEASGLVQSKRYPGLFWTHNDSGDDARIFAIQADGIVIHPNDDLPYDGILVEGAQNVDWESIAISPRGELLIADLGNNANQRRDLTLYRIPEPNPYTDRSVNVTDAYSVYYPEQKAFPPGANNFDCEAAFFWGPEIYLLTKHRADSLTTLYKFSRSAVEPYALKLVDSYDLGGMVTAADADYGRIAVLTYRAVWVFEPRVFPAEWVKGPLDLYSGQIWWRPIHARQCESIAFVDRETLLIGNEQRQLFELKVDLLVKLKGGPTP